MHANLASVTDDEFWKHIALLNGRADEPGCHRLYLALRRVDAAIVGDFQERLAEVLFHLDMRALSKQKVRDVDESRWRPRIPLSDDAFLYARCAVVAAGRAVYQGVLDDPGRFAGRWDLGAEHLLNVAPDAYKGVTGREWDWAQGTRYDYETGSNPTGGW